MGIARQDGSAFVFRGTPAGAIEWVRCERYDLSDDAHRCQAVEKQALPVDFYEAAFWSWLRVASPATIAPLTQDELSRVLAVLNKQEVMREAEIASRDRAALLKKLDFYRHNFPGSEEEAHAKKAFDPVNAAFLTIPKLKESYAAAYKTETVSIEKAKKAFKDTVAQVQDSVNWISEPSKVPHIGREFFKSMGLQFESGRFKALSPTAASDAKGWAQIVFPLINPWQGETPILSTSQSNYLCFFDSARERKTHCFGRGGNPLTLSTEQPLSQPVARMAGTSISSYEFMLETTSGELFPASVQGATTWYNAYTMRLQKELSSRNAQLFQSDQQSGLLATSRDDHQTALHWTQSDGAISKTMNLGDADAIAIPTNVSTLACWSRKSDGKVECKGEGTNPGYHRPIPASGLAPEAVQQLEIKRIAIGTSYDGYNTTPALCTASPSTISCVFKDDSKFIVPADSSRGLFVFNNGSYSSSDPSDYIVCALGREKLSCFSGTGAGVTLDGFPQDSRQIAAFAVTMPGACLALQNEIKCSASSPMRGSNPMKLGK